MWFLLAALIFGLCLLLGVVVFARRDGLHSARLAALKKEIQERERANRIIDNVRNTPIDRVREKLKQTK